MQSTPTSASLRTPTDNDGAALAFQLRVISWLAIVVMVPLVFYYTTLGTWDLTRQIDGGGWSANFFNAQAESMLVHGRLDVPQRNIGSECWERDSRCYGYFGITPSMMRIPFIGIARWLHSALTPLYLGIAVLLAYWAALQMLQRSLRERADPARPRALVLGYAVAGALALGPAGNLIFLARPAVYEEAIAWGVAFLLLAFNHVWAWHSRERRSLIPAVLCGIAAANARPTAATACAVLGLIVALWYVVDARVRIRTTAEERDAAGEADDAEDAAIGAVVKRRPASRRALASVLVAALCLVLLPGLTAAGVFWLKLRTPMPDLRTLEQVQEAPFWRQILRKNGDKAMGLVFAPTALVAYLRPDTVKLRHTWPFFAFRFPDEPILYVHPLKRGGAFVERVASATTTMPLPWIVNVIVALWLGLAAWKLSVGRRRGQLWSRGFHAARAPALTTEQWIFSTGLLGSAVAMVALSVTTVGITNRYLGDFFATSVVGVALGHHIIVPFLSRRPFVRAMAATAALVLIGWSIVVTLSLNTQLVFP